MCRSGRAADRRPASATCHRVAGTNARERPLPHRNRAWGRGREGKVAALSPGRVRLLQQRQTRRLAGAIWSGSCPSHRIRNTTRWPRQFHREQQQRGHGETAGQRSRRRRPHRRSHQRDAEVKGAGCRCLRTVKACASVGVCVCATLPKKKEKRSFGGAALDHARGCRPYDSTSLECSYQAQFITLVSSPCI